MVPVPFLTDKSQTSTLLDTSTFSYTLDRKIKKYILLIR